MNNTASGRPVGPDAALAAGGRPACLELAALAGRGTWRAHPACPGPVPPTTCCWPAAPRRCWPRRRYPVPVLAVALAAALAAGRAALSGPIGWLVLVVAFVNAVVYRKRAAAIVSLVIGYLVSVWPPWLIGTRGHTSAAAALGLLAGLITLLSAAELIRARNQRAIAVRPRRRRRPAPGQRRTAGHRPGPARRGGAQHLGDQRAGQHRAAPDGPPARTGPRSAHRHPRGEQAGLGELRSVLGVLRADGDDAPLVPSPGLDRLGELTAHTRTAGIAVRVVEEGEPRPMPAGVDAAAYRIVQEALTNTVRHSGGRAATVRLCYDPDALTIEVDDDGRTAHPPRPGNGVAGMTERARALGGTLAAGPGPAAGSGSWPGCRQRDRGVIRAALADDQALVRSGFAALLDAEEDITVVGEAADGSQAVRLAARERPDVLLMDIRMPGLDGIEATRTIAADPALGAVHVIILTTFELDEYIFAALRSGAAGFLVKDTDAAELIRAVRTVAAGEALLSPGVTRRLIAEFAARTRQARPVRGMDDLTDREREVLALIAQGLSNEEIAGQIYVSPSTVKTHAARAMMKLGARDRAQLVVFAYEAGLVRPGWA